MRYGLFIDESGTASGGIDPNCPMLTVCAVLFEREAYRAFDADMLKLKQEIFGRTDIVFHSKEIRKKVGPFKILLNAEKNRLFIEGINGIVTEHRFRIIAAVIDKKRYIATYPLSTADLYKVALEFIMERCMYHIDDVSVEPSTVSIIAESRGANEDKPLLAAYNRILDVGNRYNPPKRFKKFFQGMTFKKKKDLILGLELADLCAFPIGRHAADPEKSHVSYPVVCPKMLTDKKGRVDGWGFKVFPVP